MEDSGVSVNGASSAVDEAAAVRCVRSNDTTSSSLSSNFDLFEAEVALGPLLRTMDDGKQSFWRR
jgi:hypothetical protein